MPLLMAFFFSIMLMPIFRFFRKLRVPEVIAVFLPILLFAIFAALIICLFYSQVSVFVSDFPKIQRNIVKHLDNLSIWIDHSLGYSPAEQIKFINVQSNKMFGSVGGILSNAFGSLSGTIIFWGLLPIYIYLIILYRGIFVKFTLMWFKSSKHQNIEETIRQTEKMVKSYLIGLLIQIIYIVVLLGGSLMIFGIQNALLIGIIFALLNLIPYLGALIGNILGVLITLASSDNLIDILIVIGAITVVQFLDNNILMPGIVGSQVKINPLVSIAGIFIGGIIAGISGMFLAMPVLAVLKIVFDRSVNYKQWGVLIGAERPK
ncbi:pheromone autoinducer 2 transporter [mine drainage metagenome]|uniref:Pheromone autoinducer 2 transporter n=1 Tax=mine drainage metagenome TaxID=410659 RepID=A0A1J5P1Q3_9ZZZZ